MSEKQRKELESLRIEDFLCIVFAVLAFINLYGDQVQKKFVLTGMDSYDQKANDIFTFTLVITFLIYIYYLYRNYNTYKSAPQETKKLYEIKLFGSILLICGAICLLYFQTHNKTFTTAPSI